MFNNSIINTNRLQQHEEVSWVEADKLQRIGWGDNQALFRRQPGVVEAIQ